MSNRSTSLNGDNVASDLLNITSITLAAWHMKMPITPIVVDVLLKKVKQPMSTYVLVNVVDPYLRSHMLRLREGAHGSPTRSLDQ